MKNNGCFEMILKHGENTIYKSAIFNNDFFKKSSLFKNYDFKNCKFSKCIFENNTFRNCIFTNCDFEYCILGIENDYAIFNRCKINNCNFNKCKMNGGVIDTIINNSNICNCDFDKVNIYYCSLNTNKISNCNIQVDLYGSSINKNNFIYNSLYGTICNHNDKSCHTNFKDNKKIFNKFLFNQCPNEGEFIGYKKINFESDEYIVKLKIPASAKRLSCTTEKCRCEFAKVLEIQNIKTKEFIDSIQNKNYCGTVYTVGDFVYPDSFDDNHWNECSHGIHFFIDKENAINY